MAGFDFYQSYKPDAEPLLRSLLVKLQRVCRTYNLEVHFAHERNDSRYYVTVDGPLPMMQASAAALVTVLGPFAEGAAAPADRRRRQRIADQLARNYWRHVIDMGDSVFSIAGELGGVPNSYIFDTDGHRRELDERMWSLTRTLIAYENGAVGPPQIIEEVHTALEWLMREAIGHSRTKQMTYAEMVEHLRDVGIVDSATCLQVLAMKDIRRDAKHRGVAADREHVNEVIHPSIEACHGVLRHIEQHPTRE